MSRVGWNAFEVVLQVDRKDSPLPHQNFLCSWPFLIDHPLWWIGAVAKLLNSPHLWEYLRAWIFWCTCGPWQTCPTKQRWGWVVGQPRRIRWHRTPRESTWTPDLPLWNSSLYFLGPGSASTLAGCVTLRTLFLPDTSLGCILSLRGREEPKRDQGSFGSLSSPLSKSPAIKNTDRERSFRRKPDPFPNFFPGRLCQRGPRPIPE